MPDPDQTSKEPEDTELDDAVELYKKERLLPQAKGDSVPTAQGKPVEIDSQAEYEAKLKSMREKGLLHKDEGCRDIDELIDDPNIGNIEWRIEKFFPKVGITMIYGPPKAGKSQFLSLVMYCISHGRKLLDRYEVEKCKCLYIDEENRWFGMKYILSLLRKGMGFENLAQSKVACDKRFRVNNPDSILWLDNVLKNGGYKVVIFDSVSKIFPLDERDEKEVKKIFNLLDPLVRKYGVLFVLIHHTKKKDHEQKFRTIEDASGSREFGAIADTAILIEKWWKEGTHIKLTDGRYMVEEEDIIATIEGNKEELVWKFKGFNEELKKTKTKEKIVVDILKWQQEEGIVDFCFKEVKKAMEDEFDHKESNIRSALESLMEAENLRKTGYGKYSFLKPNLKTSTSKKLSQSLKPLKVDLKNTRKVSKKRKEI